MKKAILITGASSGFGLLLASQLHRQGHHVIGTSREPEKYAGKLPFKLLRLNIHGPVIDDTGGYGVSLYRIGNDEDIAAFTSADPIVKNGIGHYEHFVMPHLASRS